MRLTQLIFILCAIPACAINNIGIIAGQVKQGDGAITYTTYTPGLHIRTHDNDPGLSLGYSRRICLGEDVSSSPESGWYFFRLPEMPARCYASDLSTFGAEVHLGIPDISLTVGVRYTTILAHTPIDISEHYSLYYDISKPDSAFLRIDQHARQP